MNNIKQILDTIGLGDGEGNTSSMRVIVVLVVLTILAPKIVLAIKTGAPPEFSAGDIEALGVSYGAKLFQNHQENKTP